MALGFNTETINTRQRAEHFAGSRCCTFCFFFKAVRKKNNNSLMENKNDHFALFGTNDTHSDIQDVPDPFDERNNFCYISSFSSFLTANKSFKTALKQ